MGSEALCALNLKKMLVHRASQTGFCLSLENGVSYLSKRYGPDIPDVKLVFHYRGRERANRGPPQLGAIQLL